MLERTAAALESRGLQRIIPKTSNRSRTIHTGFWQHGASAIDLSNPLLGSMRTAEGTTSEPETKQLQPNLLASILVLDFLYPKSTIPLLRRLYPELPNPQHAQRTAIVPTRRAYSSIIPPNTTETTGENETTTFDQPASSTAESRPHEIADIAGDPSLFPDGKPMVHTEAQPELQQVRQLRQLLDRKGRDFQEVWDQFSVLDNDQRGFIRGQVVQYLSRSHSIVETGRALSIFRQIPPDSWDNATLTAGIILLLRSGDLPSAVECFKTGLETRGLNHGLEYLMADAINSRKWSAALEVWVSFYRDRVKRKPEALAPDLERLQQLSSLPSQGSLYFAFRAFLVGEGAEQLRKIKQDSIASRALSAFRKFFANMALREPCRPKQAIIILETLKDRNAYNTYLNTMFDRWMLKQESRSTMEQLIPIYQKFRELPDAQPAMTVYRGMFKVCFPQRSARLEEIREDWIRFKGGLNQWGYEKYLKYYAQRGDVRAVADLWPQYVRDFPEVLQSPRGFRSSINVYAQVGDVEGAKKEMDKMLNEYQVEPDLDCWNTYLKAYMRTNDYDAVMKLFEEIAEKHEPDAYTFAHAMAMTAKRGDLETTLELFTRSQEAEVEITKEMGLALVVAYCQNGLLSEAESLCVELTHRKLISGAIWNQLINFNGVEGKLDKVYELLKRMREFGVEWDDETYTFLLQALVRVNQIHPAYNLLKRGIQENLFLATPAHFAIVMAGAARVGEYELVENLFRRLQESELPVTFSAWVALVGSAVKRKPGVGRTKELGKELVEYFQKAAEAAKGTEQSAPDKDLDSTDASNITRLKGETKLMGRAIALLVELRDFGSIEELTSLFVEIFPEFQTQQFPPDIMSALIRAHHADENYNKAIELWEKTWQNVYASSRKRSGGGIMPGTEYSLSRALDAVAMTYKEIEDPEGLSNAVDKVTEAGFKLTRQNWVRIIRDLSDMNRFERAMYWCEKMLMPGWEGWTPPRPIPRLLRNTRLLKPPSSLIYRLQQKWIDIRKMAAWSGDVSRVLSTVEEKYPRLYHAFTTSEVKSMPTTYVVNGKKVSPTELDKVLQSLSYHSLLKVKETLLQELQKEKKRETDLGVKSAPLEEVDRKKWKKMLHDRVRRYAAMWHSQRNANFELNQALKIADKSGDIRIEAKDMGSENPDDQVARHRFNYWNKFWDRYDQKQHGAPSRPKKPYSNPGHHGDKTWSLRAEERQRRIKQKAEKLKKQMFDH
ncbi:coxI translation protein CYA5 [Fusarium beomiforme]|uniref:CoxI translation protein CYA5 n=1 Tax=Fusarium beomiforme TaxID=44412 RepID=A0A9P5DU47_9HYPO|nr:coxI translation protein CYA5 [Fusarium beomiforme]